MARVTPFSGLPEFLAVATHSSFRAAAAELGVSTPAVSQAIKALELRLRQTLFQRTTRSVALTEAGMSLYGRLKPAVSDVALALESLNDELDRPTGRLRLSVPRIALDLVVWRSLPKFRRLHPEVSVEIDVNDASVDIVRDRFDAGIRIGEFIERDMVAVRITPPFRWTVVGSPGYFAERGRPKSPTDLVLHECIRYRFPTARTVYHWEFVRGKRTYVVDPPGGMTVNDHMTMVAMATLGAGLCYTADLIAAPALSSHALEGVLAPHLATKSGLYLYFPKGSQRQPKLRALIDLLVRDRD